MTHAYPVYTIEAECQDCYKCVRHCPVKAIRVRDGHAAVIPELCVACGKCVEVCPVKAKQVRNGTGRLRLLLSEPAPVYASLAPSWVSEFKNVTSGQLIRALKQLGFAGVSETALGAQLVSAQVARELVGLPDRSGFRAQIPAPSRRLHHAGRFAADGARPDAARPVRGRHPGGLHRPLHRQKK